VTEHAEAEEIEEFPAMLDGHTVEERQRSGRLLKATETIASTHSLRRAS
jgi:hypothetical protein